MSFEDDIKLAEKSLGVTAKGKKKRLPRKNPRQRVKGTVISCSVPSDIADWLNSLMAKSWKKSDIISAGLVMVYMLENNGEMPDIDDKDYPYRPWEGDTIESYKDRTLETRRKNTKKLVHSHGIGLPKLAIKKPKDKTLDADGFLDIEADGYEWE